MSNNNTKKKCIIKDCKCQKPASPSLPVDNIVSLAHDKIKAIMIQRETILEAFMAETGFKPSECEQIEERTESGIRWYVRKRQG